MIAMVQAISTTDAAKALGISPVRVRHLCAHHEIGTIIGHSRILSPKDLQKLREIPREMGRPKKTT